MFDQLKSEDEHPTSAGFWAWFQQRCQDLKLARISEEHFCSLLCAELRKIHLLLSYDLNHAENGKRSLVVTGADRESFMAAHGLASTAPYIPGWQVSALRARGHSTHIIDVDDLRVCTDEVWFRLEARDGAVDVTLFLPCHGATAATRAQAAFLLLTCALGDLELDSRIGDYRVEELPAAPHEHGLQPLALLALELDALYAMRGAN